MLKSRDSRVGGNPNGNIKVSIKQMLECYGLSTFNATAVFWVKIPVCGVR